MSCRDFDTVIIESFFTLIPHRHDTEDDPISCFDLLHIRGSFFTKDTLQIENNRWHIRIDEGEWTVFEFATRVALSMNIGEFFELEGTFMGCTVEHISSEEEEIFILRIFLHDRLQEVLVTELFFEFPWDLTEVTDDLTSIFDLEITLHAERERHKDEDSELSDDIFGRCNSDLDSGMRIETHIRHTGDRRSDDIHDTKCQTSFFLYHLEALTDISRLP